MISAEVHGSGAALAFACSAVAPELAQPAWPTASAPASSSSRPTRGLRPAALDLRLRRCGQQEGMPAAPAPVRVASVPPKGHAAGLRPALRTGSGTRATGARDGWRTTRSVRSTEPNFAAISLARFALMSDHAIVVEGLEKSYGAVRALCGVELHRADGHGARAARPERRRQDDRGPDPRDAAGARRRAARASSASTSSATPPPLRAEIGLAGQYAAVDENLTGFENLEMVGRLYHLRAPRRAGARTSCSSASS